MDKQQAKFLLSSFRPDGADASLPEFADALRLAAEDRELGEWLAQERAADAAFAQALNEVSIPNSLRDEILAVLEYDGAQSEDLNLDSIFTGGMTAIAPPSGLREQILTAMELEKNELHSTSSEEPSETNVWRWLSVAGIAAAVAVGTFASFNPSVTKDNGAVVAIDPPSLVIDAQVIQPVAVHNAMNQIVTKLKAADEIDLKTDLTCAHDAMNYLSTKDHPVPSDLPAGLEEAKLVGARDMYLDSGQPISLLCFEKEGLGLVHLIVVDSESLSDANELKAMKSITLKNCYGCKRTKFNIAHWREGDKAYMLLTKANKKEMVKLF